SITLDGALLRTLPMISLARRRAVLLQDSSLDFAFTVVEVIELGRLPFSGTPMQLEDDTAIATAAHLAGVDSFMQRSYQTLSGGEKQRVQFARAIAQAWRPCRDGPARSPILAEPTPALGLRPHRPVLDVAPRPAADGLGVLAAVTDLDPAPA